MSMLTVLPKTINQSQIKTFRRCERQHKYHYIDNLEAKNKGRAITIGLWGHRALETHYTQGDWRVGYDEHLQKYNRLFDEEREILDAKGKLPDLVRRAIKSYLWYYRNENIKVHIVEKTFEIVIGNVRFKGRIDWYIEDEEGRCWVGDHKWVGTIPRQDAFHAMDLQLMLYPYAVEKAWGLRIDGVMWNYVRAKAPTVPHQNKDGSMSRAKITSDYPTVVRFLKSIGEDPRDYSNYLAPLKAKSPFLQRYWLPREEHVTQQILLEAIQTGRRINRAVLHPETITRNITKDCSWCAYQLLCRADLEGHDTASLINRFYQPVEEDDGVASYSQYSDFEQDGGSE